MTDESHFQSALDADPTDWQTRLVFADWLLDRGDPRWEGMRWLGMERKWPRDCTSNDWFDYQGWNWYPINNDSCAKHHLLPIWHRDMAEHHLWFAFNSRAEAEDAFCRAYPALAAAHPAEFAVGVMA